MKLRNFQILVSAFMILSPSALLSGCTNPPALSQPSATSASSLMSRKGQKCHVEYHDTDKKNSIASGTFKEVDEDWVVLENVTDPIQSFDSKAKTIKRDYFIVRRSVISISFDKPNSQQKLSLGG